MSADSMLAPDCPECGSQDVVEFQAGPSDEKLRTSGGGVVMQCRACLYIFPALIPRSSKDSHVETIGDEISDDRICSDCSYTLRTLTVGGRCPECGARIPTKQLQAKLEAIRGVAPKIPKAIFSLMGIAGLLFGSRSGLNVAMSTIGFGGVMVLHGVYGAVGRRIVNGRRGRVWTGRAAIIIGILIALLGAGSFGVGVVILVRRFF